MPSHHHQASLTVLTIGDIAPPAEISSWIISKIDFEVEVDTFDESIEPGYLLFRRYIPDKDPHNSEPAESFRLLMSRPYPGSCPNALGARQLSFGGLDFGVHCCYQLHGLLRLALDMEHSFQVVSTLFRTRVLQS